jgi:exosome complex RNA-binding protein Csl4
MAPKMSMNLDTSPMRTRPRNKEQHPGAIVASKPRRTKAEMAIVRQQEVERKHARQKEQKQAIEHIAELEDGLRLEDIAREVDCNASKENALISSGRFMRQHSSLMMLSC